MRCVLFPVTGRERRQFVGAVLAAAACVVLALGAKAMLPGVLKYMEEVSGVAYEQVVREAGTPGAYKTD